MVKGFAERAGLLRAVEDGELFHALGERGEERGGVEGEEKAHLEHAELGAAGVQVVHRFGDGLGAAAHDDDDAVRVRRAVVVEEMILAPRDPGKLVHRRLHDARERVVEPVARFAGLEIHIRVLRRAADGGRVGVEGARAERVKLRLRKDGRELFVGKGGDFGHLVRSAEAVEEMQERHAGLERGRVGDGGKVIRLLARAGTKHGKARGAARHDVGLVAKDGQRIRGKGARRDVHGKRQQLARDFIHIGDHQQQPLRSGERGRERPREQAPVNGARDARLGLELDDTRRVPPDVFAARRRPLVRRLRHGRRRRDGVNGNDFAKPVRHGRHSFVGIHCYVVGGGVGGHVEMDKKR